MVKQTRERHYSLQLRMERQAIEGRRCLERFPVDNETATGGVVEPMRDKTTASNIATGHGNGQNGAIGSTAQI